MILGNVSQVQSYHIKRAVVLQLGYVEVSQVGVVGEAVVDIRVVAEAGKGHRELVVVGVRQPDAAEVPPDGQTEDDDLESGDEELEDEEAWVAVDPHQVLPAEGGHVDGTGETGTSAAVALAGGGQGGSESGRCDSTKTTLTFGERNIAISISKGSVNLSFLRKRDDTSQD